MAQAGTFHYYSKNQAEQFRFYKIPKALFTDQRFRQVSAEAKILYGLMLDRMSLSMKNGWLDQQNRVYIYFTLEDAVELLGCGHGKAVRLFAELDSKKGIGLIERRKQGQGKPAKIYVKSFWEEELSDKGPDENKPSPDQKETDLPQDHDQPSPFENPSHSQTESQDLSKTGSLDLPNWDRNDTDRNKKERSDTKLSDPSNDGMEEMEYMRERQQVERMIRRNIEYDILLLRNPSYEREIEEMVSLMTEAAASRRRTLRLDKQDIPQPMVKERLLGLQCEHMEYVLESMQNSAAKIHNIRAYLLTALYHAPETINHYYAAQLREEGLV